MSEFTPEEWHYISRVTAERAGSHVWFFASVLLAPVLFAIYGALQQDFLAVLIAFAGILALFFWLLSSSNASRPVLASICAKLIAARHAEKRSEV